MSAETEAKDAIELLKEQEPKVITREGLKQFDERPCWFESHGTYMGEKGFWIIPYMFTCYETMYYVYPLYQQTTKGCETKMTEQEKQMELCSHAWIYDHTEYDTVYLRCPYCNMVRMAMPGEPCHIVNQELKIRHDGEEGDA